MGPDKSQRQSPSQVQVFWARVQVKSKSLDASPSRGVRKGSCLFTVSFVSMSAPQAERSRVEGRERDLVERETHHLEQIPAMHTDLQYS